MVTPDLFFLMSFLHPQPYIITFFLDFMDLCFSNYIMAGNFELYMIFFFILNDYSTCRWKSFISWNDKSEPDGCLIYLKEVCTVNSKFSRF